MKKIVLVLLGCVALTTTVLAYFQMAFNRQDESARAPSPAAELSTPPVAELSPPPVAELSAEKQALAAAEAAKKFALLRRQADEGYPEAQKQLAMAYSTGRGTKKDPVLGKMWWNIVAMDGDKTAVEKRDALRGKMSPADIAEADRLTWAWRATHVLQQKPAP